MEDGRWRQAKRASGQWGATVLREGDLVLLLAVLFFGALGGSCSSWSFFLPPGPLPMEAIEKMARFCMRDLDEDEEGTDEDDVEADDDLLVSTGPGQAIPSQCPVQHPDFLPWSCIPAGRAK